MSGRNNCFDPLLIRRVFAKKPSGVINPVSAGTRVNGNVVKVRYAHERVFITKTKTH